MGMTTVETDIYQYYLKMSQDLYLVLGRAKEGEIGNNNFTFTGNCNFVYFNVTIAPIKQELSFMYHDINFIILNNGKRNCSLFYSLPNDGFIFICHWLLPLLAFFKHHNAS